MRRFIFRSSDPFNLSRTYKETRLYLIGPVKHLGDLSTAVVLLTIAQLMGNIILKLDIFKQ